VVGAGDILVGISARSPRFFATLVGKAPIGQEPVILAEGLSVFGPYRATVRHGIPMTYETGVTV
jgi:hypothetical protein